MMFLIYAHCRRSSTTSIQYDKLKTITTHTRMRQVCFIQIAVFRQAIRHVSHFSVDKPEREKTALRSLNSSFFLFWFIRYFCVGGSSLHALLYHMHSNLFTFPTRKNNVQRQKELTNHTAIYIYQQESMRIIIINPNQ